MHREGFSISQEHQNRYQSTVAPDATTTSPQLSTSNSKKSANSALEVNSGTAPKSDKRWRISGFFIASCMASFSRCVIDSGVPLGAMIPNQEDTSKVSKPDSCMVGKSGAESVRLLVVTAKARNLLPVTWGQAEGILSKAYSTWPPISSVYAGALPL